MKRSGRSLIWAGPACLLLLTWIVLTMAGCGGGGGQVSPPPPPPSPSPSPTPNPTPTPSPSPTPTPSPTPFALSPAFWHLDRQSTKGSGEIVGSGFAASDTVTLTGLPLTKTTFVNSGEWDLEVTVDDSSFDPGHRVDGTVSNGTTSQTATSVFLGNGQNPVAVVSDGSFFVHDSSAGVVRWFDASRVLKTSFTVGKQVTSIAFNPLKRNLIVGHGSSGPITEINVDNPAQFFTQNNVTGSVMGVATSSATANGCVAQTNEGFFTFFSADSTDTSAPHTTAVPGSEPWSAAVGSIGGTEFCVGYSRGDRKLHKITLPAMGFEVTTTLSDLNPGGHPTVSVFTNGTIEIFHPEDHKAEFIRLSDLSHIATVTLQNSSTLAPVAVAADSIGGQLFVLRVDVSNFSTTLTKVPLGTMVETTPFSTTPGLALVGLGVRGTDVVGAVKAQTFSLPLN